MKYFLYIVVSLTTVSAHAQPKQSIFFELGKTGLIYNLGYDRKIADKPIGYRIAAGTNFGQYLTAITALAGGYYLIGKKNSFFEAGADIQYLFVDKVSDDQVGLTFVYPDYTSKNLAPVINLGYRKYGRLLIRIGFSISLIDEKIVPGGYVTLGGLLRSNQF